MIYNTHPNETDFNLCFQSILLGFGGHPQYNDNAYFIQTNCEFERPNPESCAPNQPLQWDLNGEALKVYRVKGTPSGSHTFDLKDWSTGKGGSWLHWYVKNKKVVERAGTSISCRP